MVKNLLARFYGLNAIAFDTYDNVLVTNTHNHAIRQVLKTGLVRTVVDDGPPGCIDKIFDTNTHTNIRHMTLASARSTMSFCRFSRRTSPMVT